MKASSKQGSKEENFRKFTIELLPLKPQVNQDTKAMHYQSTVDALMNALESKLGDDDGEYAKNKKKGREREIDEEFESAFKT